MDESKEISISPELAKRSGQIVNMTASDLNNPATIGQMMEDVVSKEEIYETTEDETKADFNEAKIMKRIDSALYMELPLWRKKIKGYLNDLESLHKYMESYAIVTDYVNEQAKAKTPEEQLAIYNRMKNAGLTMNMEMKSFIDKYDVNKSFLEEALKKIEDRIESEKTGMAEAVTSQKTKMFIKILENNKESFTNNDKYDADGVKEAIKFTDNLIKIYNDRANLDWIDHLAETGTNFKAIYAQYLTNKRNHISIESLLQSAFGASYVPLILVDNYIDLEKIPYNFEQFKEFFLYVLCYISSVSNSNKKLKMNQRLNKERALIVVQNLSDCDFELFDIPVDGEDTDPKKCTIDYMKKIVEKMNVIYLLTIGVPIEKAKGGINDEI